MLMGANGALGWCALEAGDLETAVGHYEEASQSAQAMGAQAYIAVFLVNLGEARLALGDTDRARGAIDRGRELAHTGRPRTQAQLLNVGGRLLRADGDRSGARKSLLEALELFESVGDPQGQGDTLEDLAGLAVDEGHYDRAARLFGAGQAIHDRIGYVRFPHRRLGLEADRQRAVDAVGPAAFDEAFGRGATEDVHVSALAREQRTASAPSVPGLPTD
jgi:tetratricopeptide (TPR) repeat protein